MVKIEGVGAVYECPKKDRCLFCFHRQSAVRSIPIGLGEFVDLANIILAFGREVGKLNARCAVGWKRKWVRIWPKRP